MSNKPLNSHSSSLVLSILVAAFLCCGVSAASEAPRGVPDVSTASLAGEPQKSTGPPIIGNLIITFSDVASAGVHSFGYTERERSLDLTAGDAQATVQVLDWPAEAASPVASVHTLALVADNAAAALQQAEDLDVRHTEKSARVLDSCRQAAFLAASRPDKYGLVLQVKIRDLGNFVQGGTPSWPSVSVYLSEEFFSCRVERK